MRRLKVGKAGRRVSFLRELTISDGGGGHEGFWTVQFSCWARFRRLYGSESTTEAGVRARQAQEVTIRAGSLARRIATDWRMDDHTTGASFNIREIVISEARGEITLICESGVPA